MAFSLQVRRINPIFNIDLFFYLYLNMSHMLSKNRSSVFYLLFLLAAAPTITVNAQRYTLGVGNYPGDPKENFAPSMKIDAVHYRNLALNRPAYQSSAYDYDLTAQLVTDGIVDTALPGWIVVTTSNGDTLPRDGREHAFDGNVSTQQIFQGAKAWMQIGMAGNYDLPEVDSFNLSGTVIIDTLQQPAHWEIGISGSADGIKWEQLGETGGDGLPGRDGFAEMARRFAVDPKKMPPEQLAFLKRFAPPNRRILQFPFKLNGPVRYRYYRLDLNDAIARSWAVSEMGLFDKGFRSPVGGPYSFTSAWKSASAGPEWVYVDLGSECSFDRVRLNWIRPAVSGSIQSSDDAVNWTDIASLPGDPGHVTDIRLNREIKARFVRVSMTKPLSMEEGYILSELEVMGKGGPVPVAHPPAAGEGSDGRKDLAGGGWKLRRAGSVRADGLSISQPGFNDADWLIATVPATTLVSFVNDGALADPNFGDNQMLPSDAYFYSDFWYRDVFMAPLSYKGHKMYLNFDGINWQAEVYLNGREIGRIGGAFIRGNFDVTGILIPGGKNVLAVKIIRNDTPGFPTEQNRNSTDANGGELGADNPTFHASIGWDWIPTIRGRNTGIWNDVYLSRSGPVTLENPLVLAGLPLPDTSHVSIDIRVTLHNTDARSVKGKLIGQFGDSTFEESFMLYPSETRDVVFIPSSHRSLRLQHPRLWWPNGYGEQNLYKVRLRFVTGDGEVSDEKTFRTGIRRMSYSTEGGALKIFVNGKRFIPRGGNWGMSEDMLRYRAREYDIAVRYHKEMNFNIIRNWVGQTDDDAFYEACDKYGIMVWQDFWLANPVDGPEPIHPDMFIKNMEDYVKRIRNHPSIAIFVGRNEGNPPPVLDSALTIGLPRLLPEIKYIPNSASGPVSGGGPYGLMPLKSYFQNNRALSKLHSEMGLPDIVSYESFRQMMPGSSIWPQSAMWGLHDFTLQGAQNGGNFNKALARSFGEVDSMKEWLSLAQWVEYQGYRAMFEAESRNRMGLIIWMSHPSWPSLTWQTYDYYFEPTAAYFACKKASEPLHIQWNPLSGKIEVVNYSIPDGSGLTAKMQILDADGVVRAKQEVAVDCPADSTVAVFPLNRPDSTGSVYFVQLELSRGVELVSRNLYMRGPGEDSTGGMGNLTAVTHLPKVKLVTDTKVSRQGDRWKLSTTLMNNTKYPALNIRLQVVGGRSGSRILPVIYDDNFITLMPGEQRIIRMELQDADTRGEDPVVNIEGLNTN
jgi:hypothetical protein